MDVALDERPGAVEPDCTAAYAIEFNRDTRFEARSLEPKIQSANSGEETYRLQHPAVLTNLLMSHSGIGFCIVNTRIER